MNRVFSVCIVFGFLGGALSAHAQSFTGFTDFNWFTDGALVNTYTGDPYTDFTYEVSQNGTLTGGTSPYLSDFRPFGTDLVVVNIGGNQVPSDPANPIVITQTLLFSSPVRDLSLHFGGALNDRTSQSMDEYLFNFSVAPSSVSSGSNAWNPVTGRLDAPGDVSLNDTFTFDGPISELSFDHSGYGEHNGINMELTELSWTPVPEPSTLLLSLIMLGTIGLSLFYSRRSSDG